MESLEDLNIWQYTTPTIRATIKTGLSDLTGYTGYIVGKKNMSDTSPVLDLSTNTWDNSTGIFGPLSDTTDTSVNNGTYQYEFYVLSSENTFTVGQGELNILKSLK